MRKTGGRRAIKTFSLKGYFQMTALTDAKALAPNAAAKAAVAVKGHDYITLQNLAIGHVNDLIVLVKSMISLHPTSGDSATLAALNTLLTELS
jgi:hypothetical protein